VRRLTAIALAVTAAATLGGGAARAGDGGPQSFAFAIGAGNLAGGPTAVSERLGRFGLVVVDGEEASRDEVAALRAGGTLVLGYLSVGTIEKWRSWYPRLKRYRLGANADWKDEWFADVSRAGLRREVAERIAPEILAKGFDGLFLDNVDMIESRLHRAQRDGMRKLVLALSDFARSDGRLLWAQNGAGALRRLGLLDSLDGWNREDVTWSYDFDRRRYEPNPAGERRAALAELRDMAARGLIVTATDYTRAGDAKAQREAVENACAAGALPFVADIGLTARRLPDPPLTCP
jgi:polysaccharide biosynthesis protein PelA